MQKDVDVFTKLLEKEKRKLMIIEDQMKQVHSEIIEKKISIDRIKKTGEIKPVQDKIDKI